MFRVAEFRSLSPVELSSNKLCFESFGWILTKSNGIQDISNMNNERVFENKKFLRK